MPPPQDIGRIRKLCKVYTTYTLSQTPPLQDIVRISELHMLDMCPFSNLITASQLSDKYC